MKIMVLWSTVKKRKGKNDNVAIYFNYLESLQMNQCVDRALVTIICLFEDTHFFGLIFVTSKKI